jgi:hypothetical protein
VYNRPVALSWRGNRAAHKVMLSSASLRRLVAMGGTVLVARLQDKFGDFGLIAMSTLRAAPAAQHARVPLSLVDFLEGKEPPEGWVKGRDSLRQVVSAHPSDVREATTQLAAKAGRGAGACRRRPPSAWKHGFNWLTCVYDARMWASRVLTGGDFVRAGGGHCRRVYHELPRARAWGGAPAAIAPGVLGRGAGSARWRGSGQRGGLAKHRRAKGRKREHDDADTLQARPQTTQPGLPLSLPPPAHAFCVRFLTCSAPARA